MKSFYRFAKLGLARRGAPRETLRNAAEAPRRKNPRQKNRRWNLAFLVVAAVAASQLGATDCGQITRDPGFDLWCGDRLCFWKTDVGNVQKVPTWIEGDDGVSMVGDDVEISQMTAVTSQDAAPDGCIEFDMTAKIDSDTELDVGLDLFGDGTIDYTQRVPTSDWEKQAVSIGWRGSYEGIKFLLIKHGSGTAIVADLNAHTSDSCPPLIDVPPRPSGAQCAAPTDCASNVCNAGVCGTCLTDTDCSNGDVCGRENEAGWLQDAHVCEAPGSRKVGELCYQASECASGICDGTLCQECADASACGTNQTCELASGTEIGECSPGQRDRASGADCVQDADCTSGHCTGTPQGYCVDAGVFLGIPCYGDADCPLNADLSPDTCTFVAVAGGTCQ